MMNDLELQTIADDWVRLHYLPEESAERAEKFWAYNKLCDLCHDEPESCWKVIHMIRCIDGSEVMLSNLAAGPVEDLLARHGADFIDRIEALAQSDQQFHKILGAVWQRDISNPVWLRVKAIAAQPW